MIASSTVECRALLVYANLREVLRDEVGVSPCATTQAVYHQLLRA